MKQKDIDYFKKLLSTRLEELLNQAGDTVSGMTTANENFPDPTDRAALESDRNFMLRIRDREHKLIKKIKKALERIDNGTFGICETCGEEISVKRLKARPVTSQCIECKSKEEALEKALGL
jgi:DnaK suppressor protein